jgi:hypothetical protein
LPALTLSLISPDELRFRNVIGYSPGRGQPIAGQPIAGQPIAGQPIAGQPIAGQPIAVGGGGTAGSRRGHGHQAGLVAWAAMSASPRAGGRWHHRQRSCVGKCG